MLAAIRDLGRDPRPSGCNPRAIGVQGVTLSRALAEIAAVDALRVELDVRGDLHGSALARKLGTHLRDAVGVVAPRRVSAKKVTEPLSRHVARRPECAR